MNDTSPKYFAQIPIDVMSSKELNSTDKCIYGVIYTMLNVTHKCFMSNARIGSDIGMQPKTVSKSITKLARLGFVNVELTYKDGTKEVDKRYISLNLGGMPQLEHRVYSKQGIGMPQLEQDNRLLNKSVDRRERRKQTEITLQDVISNVQKSNLPMLNGKNIEDLQVWSQDLPLDVINYAVDMAADINATSFNYVKATLNDWFQKNIKSVDQAREYVLKNKQKNGYQNNNQKSNNKRGEIDEELGY
ncbi:DnaD domain protein [Fructilactobacillus vespulae]|uniref:DnaD domain protein n=1 Tax=Fructilactobacillus vespulae TaxID=1249630 RepID=UPI0039B3B89D